MEEFPTQEVKKEIYITLATLEDAAAIAHIQHEGWLATYQNEKYNITANDILSKKFESAERLQKRVDRLSKEGETTQTWIARENEQVIGYSSALKGEDTNKITSVYLLPEYQGKGVGTQLLQHALEWLGGEKDITLGVVPYNSAAIHFYQKFGFQLGDPIIHEEPTFSTGKDMPEVAMILRQKIDMSTD
jgi:ribosomal protein S18 acetylase RimI-like enzyme